MVDYSFPRGLRSPLNLNHFQVPCDFVDRIYRNSRIHCVPSSLPTGLEQLNSRASSEAEAELMKCCASGDWARRMATARPFASLEQLIQAADRIWWSLEPRDWLEAFHSHPKIGEKKAAAPTSVHAQRWSEAEQSGIRDPAQETINALAQLNREYEEKFGYIFIVCATGKSSEQMLAILRARLENPAGQELRIAAAEQAKITELRLRKLVAI
jgi:OHCU decarboxylase